MSKSRRRFLKTTSLGLLGAATLRTQAQTASNLPPGEPPAFGTGTPVGPEVSPATFAEAEKLVQVELTDAERTMAADSWRRTMASLYERRTGPRKLALETTLAPATRWDPVLPGIKVRPSRIASCAAIPIRVRCPRATRTSRSRRSPSSRDGSSTAGSPLSG